MTPLEQIAQALEHARPHVKGAALEREIGDALLLARTLVNLEGLAVFQAARRRAEQEAER